MSYVISSFDDLSAAFGGDVEFASALKRTRTCVLNWRSRGFIPPARFPEIIDAASERRILGISFEVLRNLTFAAKTAEERS